MTDGVLALGLPGVLVLGLPQTCYVKMAGVLASVTVMLSFF